MVEKSKLPLLTKMFLENKQLNSESQSSIISYIKFREKKSEEKNEDDFSHSEKSN